MPTITFTSDTWPESTEEFRRVLREAWEKSRPLDDFVEIVKHLAVMEREYDMDSAEFYGRYHRGEMGDDMKVMGWASDYEIYREMKEELDKALSAMERFAIPAIA